MTSGIEEKGSTKVERVEITLLPKCADLSLRGHPRPGPIDECHQPNSQYEGCGGTALPPGDARISQGLVNNIPRLVSKLSFSVKIPLPVVTPLSIVLL